MSLVDIDDFECVECGKIIRSTLNIKTKTYFPIKCKSCINEVIE